MALESKTLLNDVGSAVLVEVVSQLNTAQSTTPLTTARMPTAAAGGGALDAITCVNAAVASGVIFSAHEECLVTSIRMCSLTTILSGIGVPATTGLCIWKLPPVWIDGTPATQDTQLVATANGNNIGVALGTVGTYTVEFLSTGAPFTAPLGCDVGQVFELGGVQATGPTPASTFAGTLLAGNHAATVQPVSMSAGGIAMGVGDMLLWALANTTGAAVQLMFSVGYRPVKDALNLQPAFTPKMTNFRSVPR